LANEATIILSDQQNYATLAYTCSLWDFEEMIFLVHLLRSDDLFLDIGANVGSYSVLASAIAGARTIAFEPVPATYNQLLRNVRANGIEDRTRCLQIGLGDLEGTISMTADRGGLNYVISEGWKSGATVDVPMRRLDDVLADESSRFVKIDTEGFELNVLRGGTRTFSNPELMALVVELNGSGNRYGHSDEEVHAEIIRFGFAACKYDCKTRTLTPISTFDRTKINRLYVRDISHASRRVAAGPTVRVRGHEF
jgi:FkbM family methyltransferase